MIKKSELYFSNKFAFNDPYDLQLPLIFDGGIKINIEYAERIYKQKHGRSLSAAQLKELQLMPDATEDSHPEMFNEYRNEISNNTSQIEDSLGVYCLSRNSENPVMWSHYADQHRGFCVGFEAEKLDAFLKKHYTIDYTCGQVEYANEIPKYIPESSMNKIMNYVQKRFRTKFADWKYEEETRLLIRDMAGKSIVIPPDLFTEIIFGCRMDEKHKEELITACENRYSSISFFTATLSRSAFRMDVHKI